ncbi:MAG: class C sortase, partial [Clostridiales bacterium]|nr:class C sortase [Clostridiales bacterium]
MKKRRSRITSLVLSLLFLVGLGLILYPTVSDYWNSLHSSRAIATYSEQVANIDDDMYDELWSAAYAYNEELAKKENQYITEGENGEYWSLLNIGGGGVMGYIEIPAINVSLPIYHGTEESILQVAAGHIEWSSLPVGGFG